MPTAMPAASRSRSTEEPHATPEETGGPRARVAHVNAVSALAFFINKGRGGETVANVAGVNFLHVCRAG